MLSFLLLHGGTIFVGTLVLAVLISITVKLVRDKRKGKNPGCGCGCSECHHSGDCHTK